MLAALMIVLPVYPARPSSAGPASRPADQFTVEQLIDRLTQITNDEFSLRTNIFAGDALPQGLMRLQEAELKPSDAMGELVRRGDASLPGLLSHLDDGRKTKATIHGMFGSGITYAAEYDWKPQEGKERPAGVERDAFEDRHKLNIVGRPEGNEYTVAVGDLCFNIVGDIVNRRYEAVRYQPTAIVIVNSPVLCPDLRDAVRSEWTKLTPEEHRRSLLADATKPDWSGRADGGISRLLRYYPDAAASAVLKRLDAPLYDWGPIREFAQQTLYTTADAAVRKKLIDDFIAKNGAPSRDGLILQLWEDRSYKVDQQMWYPGPAPIVKVAPDDILTTMIGKHSIQDPPSVDAVTYNDMANFIKELGNAPSAEIDQAVWETFRKHRSNHGPKWENDDYIAGAAIKRLLHKGHDAEFLAFCERRTSEFLPPSPFGAEGSARDLIRLLTDSRTTEARER